MGQLQWALALACRKATLASESALDSLTSANRDLQVLEASPSPQSVGSAGTAPATQARAGNGYLRARRRASKIASAQALVGGQPAA